MGTKQNKKKEKAQSNSKEYGVVLKKEKKYQHKIFPQKGKVPENDDSYDIV